MNATYLMVSFNNIMKTNQEEIPDFQKVIIVKINLLQNVSSIFGLTKGILISVS